MATEEIQISELELADEVLADMVLPVDTATDTKAVTLKQLKAWLGTSLPIGSIFASVGKIDDERFSLLDGKTISRIGTYEAFCNKVVENVQAGKWKACTEEEFNLELSETGQCGKFVVSNDYVRIPKLGNSLCSGVVNGTIPVVGNGGAIVYTNGNQTVEANLMSAYGFGNSSASIASFGKGQNLGTWNSVKLTTNPTKSGIEGKINSVEVFYYMVISTEGQTEDVKIDINQVYEDMELKANTSLSNLTAEGKRIASGLGMPSNRYIDLTLGASLSYYTAPANGYFYFQRQLTGSGFQALVVTEAGYMTSEVRTHLNAGALRNFIPIRKGQQLQLQYDGSFSSSIFRFIYAEGEN